MKNNHIINESSLQVYFYDVLQEFNKKSLRPLSNEMIFYSSYVMDQFGESVNFFELEEGKVKEKTLGLKLLQAQHLSREKRKTQLKDVADMSLLVCGFFSDSLNRKIVDVKYYQEIGVRAYLQLNNLEPKVLNIKSFYTTFARHFNEITNLMSIVSGHSRGDKDSPWLIVNNPKKTA